mgnify:CR=1 FL=1
MSKEAKKKIREKFRNDCFKRDNYSCVMCSFKSSSEKALNELDCHHIVSRTEMPNGGYVKENGISLCESCHIKAERCYYNENEFIEYCSDNLYKKINSSKEKAILSSELLKGN